MSVALPKGGNVLLSAAAPGLQQVRICLGWDDGPSLAAVEVDGVVNLVSSGAVSSGAVSSGAVSRSAVDSSAVDSSAVDSSAIDGAAAASRVLLAHQIPSPTERFGTSPPPRPIVGDADKFVVTLAAVPAEVSRLQFGAAIYDAAARRQTFRSVHHPYVRLLNHDGGQEFARYEFDAETGLETVMVFGELYRHRTGWKFRAVGQGYVNGLPGLAGAEDVAETAAMPPGEVADFLIRTSRARARRNVAEHLHPPRPAAPRPTAPRPTAPRPTAPRPTAPRPTAPSAPEPAAPRPTAPRPTEPRPPAPEPAAPKPSAAPSSPQPMPPAARPVPPPPPPAPERPSAHQRRSPLDLSGPAETAPAAAAGPTADGAPARRSSPRPRLSERSSRYRQRTEQVSALDDDHPATIWTDEDRGSGAMTVTLRWAPLKTRTGLPRPSDIQLGCFWQAADGTGGVVQTPGDASAPGHGASRQVLRLGSRDERDGQTIFVDLGTLPTFKRFFVFAYGLHGPPKWALLRPVLAVATQTGEQLAVRLGEAPSNARTCVVASFHMVQDDLVIRRENDFLDGTQADAAARYGWSLEWNPDGTTLRDTL